MIRTVTRYSAALLILASLAAAQTTTIYIPDPNPTVPGGTALNTIPFGSAAYTYVGSIPASAMDPTNTRVDDISFAPGTGGLWNATNVYVGIGHLPSGPLPCPFTFPDPVTGTPGSFLDFTVAFDSSVLGPLNWTWLASQWSPMGLGAFGGTGFVWNGSSDVGIYVSFQGATLTSGFHRNPNGPPLRTYTSTYLAPTSTSCAAMFGLVTALEVSQPGNILTVAETGPGANDLFVSLTSLSDPAASEGWLLISGDVSSPVGQGPLLGIRPGPLTWDFFLGTPLTDGYPLHFPIPSPTGSFPTVPFLLPPGSTSFINGVTLDFTVLLVRPGFVYSGRSNVVRYTF